MQLVGILHWICTNMQQIALMGGLLDAGVSVCVKTTEMDADEVTNYKNKRTRLEANRNNHTAILQMPVPTKERKRIAIQQAEITLFLVIFLFTQHQN